MVQLLYTFLKGGERNLTINLVPLTIKVRASLLQFTLILFASVLQICVIFSILNAKTKPSANPTGSAWSGMT